MINVATVTQTVAEMLKPWQYAGCTHSAPSGTEIDSNTRTIYELVPAGSKKVVKDFNMGFIHSQAASTYCQIVDYAVATLYTRRVEKPVRAALPLSPRRTKGK